MRSMTGFGRAEVERDAVRIAAEVRALNQRFLELKLNLPRRWGEYEAELRKLVQNYVSRGRVEVLVRRTSLKPPPNRLMVNRQLATQYIEELRRLGNRFGLGQELPLDSMLQRQEIFQIVEEEEDSSGEIELGRRALTRALKALDSERTREGQGLKKDLAGRLRKVDRAVKKIVRLAEASRRAIVRSFQVRMRELMAEAPLDEKRLYEEASSAAQRADISEELARLTTHLEGFRTLLGRTSPIGKEIEFLLQEVNREVNTISAKSQNAALSRIAVEIKSELEKMREQVQNVE